MALKPDYCRLMAHDDCSTVCPAGNTPRWVSLSWIARVQGLELGLVWSHPMEGSIVASKSIGVLCCHFTSSVVKKNQQSVMINTIQFERFVIHEYLEKITVHRYFKFISTVLIPLFFQFIRY